MSTTVDSDTNPFEKDFNDGILTIHWPNGEFEDITGDEIERGTATLQEALCNERYFIFGGCVCNQLSFTTGSKQFMASDVILDDTKIEAYFETDGTKIKLFTGKIESAKRDSGLTRRKVIAYDEMYWYRNIDISWWYRNNTVDKETAFTQKMFRDKLFEFLGIEQVETTLYYDDAFVPTTNIPSEMNAVNIIKDMCLQNSVFGWMNRDGKFEYIRLQENGRVSGVDNAGRQYYEYYDPDYKFDNYRSCEFKEGRIWYPNEFYTDPNPRIGFISDAPTTAQEAYEKNTYYNRNSFFVGDAEWFDNVYLCNEYRDPTLQEPIIPICFGTVTTYDNQHLYLAQEYKMVPVYGNPMIKVGSSIEIEVKKTAEDGTELTWYVHSYIMSRTLKIHGSNYISDEYSANNAPYNSNNRQEGIDTTPVNTLQTESPTISYEDFTSDSAASSLADDETAKKAKLRCVKRIKKIDYDAMSEAGTLRDDTLYFTWEE